MRAYDIDKGATYAVGGGHSTSLPSNPTAITGATSAAVMLGLAGAFTPSGSGRALVLIEGDIVVGTIGDGATLQVSYGTGAAPANAGALVGTQPGQARTYIASTAAGRVPFLVHGYVTGLILGTAYWLDLAVANVTGGTATIAGVQVTAIEF